MSPMEVINNMALIERKGGLLHTEVKSLVDQKLAKAKTDKRVSALKAEEALKVVRVDDGHGLIAPRRPGA